MKQPGRPRGLRFIPSSTNFSTLPENMEESFHDDSWQKEQEDQFDKEILLLTVINGLSSDKERAVFLLEILREYGYQLDYTSIAHSLNIQLRWLMRVKASVRQKVREIVLNQA